MFQFDSFFFNLLYNLISYFYGRTSLRVSEERINNAACLYVLKINGLQWWLINIYFWFKLNMVQQIKLVIRPTLPHLNFHEVLSSLLRFSSAHMTNITYYTYWPWRFLSWSGSLCFYVVFSNSRHRVQILLKVVKEFEVFIYLFFYAMGSHVHIN